MIKKILKELKPKTIDMYIIKKFLGTFFFSIALILAIVIVFDLVEKMDNFLEKNVPWSEIVFTYYFNFLPYFANFFSPLFIFISVIFFTSKLTNNSEIVAILSSGISYPRLMRPYFMSALILGLLSFFLTGYIIPAANKKRIDFELKYIDDATSFSKRNYHRQIAPGHFAYVEGYDVSTDIGYRFSLEKFEDNQLVSKLMAERARWDSIALKWKLEDYYIRNYGENNIQAITRGAIIDTVLTNLQPQDFKFQLKSKATLNSNELDDFIEEMQNRGDDNLETFKVEKYNRFAYPFSTFILTLIGVSLSTRKKRGGTGLNIAAGIALSFLYILFMQVFSALAESNTIHSSLLAVWIPNILFIIIGAILYVFAPK